MNELSQEARALIQDAALLDEPIQGHKERMRKRLAQELGAAAFAGAAASTPAGESAAASAGANHVATEQTMTASSTPGALAGWSLSVKWGACAGLLAVALGGAFWLTQDAPSPSTTPDEVAAPESARVEAPTPPIDEQPIEIAATEVAQEPAIVPRVVPVERRKAPEARSTKAKSAKEPPEDSLAAEVALLSRAQAALRGGRPSEALQLTNEHASRFAKPVMAEERAAIELLAQCTSGEATQARAAAFLRNNPGSPMATRIRTTCKVD